MNKIFVHLPCPNRRGLKVVVVVVIIVNIFFLPFSSCGVKLNNNTCNNINDQYCTLLPPRTNLENIHYQNNNNNNGGLESSTTSRPITSSPTSAKTSSADGTTTTTTSTSSKQPHLLLVLLDDVGWANLKGYNNGASGDQYPTTPNFDASIEAGIRLKNMYVQPMCSPTRASMMTGRFPHRYGSNVFVQRPYQPTFLKEDETTLADKMVDAGYLTSLVGKWHLGYGLKKYTPSSRGFQRYFGSYEVGGGHYNHTVGPGTHAFGSLFTWGADGVQQTLDLHRETSINGGKTMATHSYVTDQRGIYSSDMFSNEAIKEIDRAAMMTPTKPLFLYLAYTTVHTPVQVPKKYMHMNSHYVKGTTLEVVESAGMMTAMDEGYGRVVNALKRNNMWENTIVMLFSDNGAMTTQGTSNYPLRGIKMGPFEGGIKSVAFLSGGHPDIVKNRGKVSNTMLHAVDVHTLLLHFAQGNPDHVRAGLPYKKLDAVNGKDLFQSIISSDTIGSPRKEFIALLDPLGYFPSTLQEQGNILLGICSAIRVGKYKLISGQPGRDDWWPVDAGKCHKRLYREGTARAPTFENKDCIRGDLRYEYIGRKKGFVPKNTWLFDIEKDPFEKNDLSEQMPDLVKQLKLRLEEEHKIASDPLPDRWDSLMGMMKGNYAVKINENGYEMALGHWQEPEHLAKISFFRKASSWLKLTQMDLESKWNGRSSQVHWKVKQNPTSGRSGDEFITMEEKKEVSEALRLAYGMSSDEDFNELQLKQMAYRLNVLEAEVMMGGGSNHNFGRAKM